MREIADNLGRRKMARFLILVPSVAQIPGIAAWILTRHIPVIRRGHSDFGYLGAHHWQFGFLCLGMFVMLLALVFCDRSQEAKKLRALLRYWVSGKKAAIFKKEPQRVNYSGVERRKRA